MFLYYFFYIYIYIHIPTRIINSPKQSIRSHPNDRLISHLGNDAFTRVDFGSFA